MAESPVLRRIVRFDSIPLSQTYFSEEGYLIDHPIVTSVGIFEYKNPDGSIRRELRLPEEVFSEKSLSSYEGKPVIVTHDAGVVDKDNIEKVTIGTILSKGYRDGENVRAKIIIHDTDVMKECGLRELSLGYSLTLDETSGEWKGQRYDAIQRNIMINHLALVSSARAGSEARLNIDGESKKQGGESMKKTKNADSGAMSPEELAASIEAYKARRGARSESRGDVEPEDQENAPMQEEPAAENEKTEGEADAVKDVVKNVIDRRDRRDSAGDPETLEDAMGVIAQQDEDIDELIKFCDQLKAKGDFAATSVDEDDNIANEKNDDGDEGKSENLNMDSVDVLVSKKLEIARIGDRLNLDGVEKLSLREGKKAIIKKVRPEMRLDDKSDVYIDAAYDIAKAEIEKRKGTDFQRGQMFNTDSASRAVNAGKSSADIARQRMIDRQNGGNK